MNTIGSFRSPPASVGGRLLGSAIAGLALGLLPPVTAGHPAAAAVFKECVTNAVAARPDSLAPSAIHGAVGQTSIVVVTNSDIGIYSKATCAVVGSKVTLNAFFASVGVPAGQVLFNPRVLYDRLSDRCLVVAESTDDTGSNSDQFLFVAGSKTSTCTSWNKRKITLSQGSTLNCKNAASHFYDYPNAGYSKDRLVVTSNNYNGLSFVNGTVMSIDKLALYDNTPGISFKCFNRREANLTPSVVGDNNAAMFIMAPGSTSIRRLKLTAGSPDTLTSTPSIAIAAAAVPPDAIQPNGQKLDTLDSRFVSASKQIGTVLLNVRSVNVGGFSRWRLYKLTTDTNAPLFTMDMASPNCPGGGHLFNASVDTNSVDPTALAFVTATRTCPSQARDGKAAMLIFRGPNASSAGWTFDTVETSASQFATAQPGGTACNSTPDGLGNGFACRWGDYSATQIDPSNTARAWGFNQLATGSDQFKWTTRAGQVGP